MISGAVYRSRHRYSKQIRRKQALIFVTKAAVMARSGYNQYSIPEFSFILRNRIVQRTRGRVPCLTRARQKRSAPRNQFAHVAQ